MKELNILHISDLHYTSQNNTDKKNLINALLKDLEQLGIEGKPNPDIVVFSGDLVQSGETQQFEDAKTFFIDPLLKKLKIDKDNFFIVPGNHDINRAMVDKIIASGIDSIIKDTNSVNDFLDYQMKDYHLNKLNNFNNFKTSIESKYKIQNTKDIYNRLFSTYYLEIRGIKIGLACLNSSWKAYKDEEKGSLLVGERQVEYAFNNIKECDIKIAVMHHPVDWLDEFDQNDIEKFISKKFDLLLHGHIHKSKSNSILNTYGDLFVNGCGCLYQSRDYLNGYSFIKYDLYNDNVTTYFRTYFNDREEFDEGTDRIKGGKITFQLKKKV